MHGRDWLIKNERQTIIYSGLAIIFVKGDTKVSTLSFQLNDDGWLSL